MAEWNRNTPWRQGHMLSDEAAIALKLKNAESPEQTVAVVISHDCDLAADPSKEPRVELILGSLIEESQGSLTRSKNARTLHLPFFRGEQKQWVELLAIEKITIAKSALVNYAPRGDFGLDRSGHSILQEWLAARYKRSAFPDAFEDRLKESGLAEKLTAILRPYGDYIRSILFDVDDGNEQVRNDPADTYALRIYVLYTTESDPEKALLAAEQVRDKVQAAFRQKLFEPSKQWVHIELCECTVVSDDVLTIAQSALFKQWRLEHLSLGEDPPQPMLPT
jgi:hypothetical protein